MADDDDRAARGRAGDDGYLNSYYQVAKPGARCVEPGLGPRALLRGPPDPGGRRPPRSRGDERLLGDRPPLRRPLVRRLRADGDGHVRAPGDRDGARRALPADRRARVPRAGAAVRRPARPRRRCSRRRTARATSRTACPVREQDEVEGHAVRALYLAAGVTDLYWRPARRRCSTRCTRSGATWPAARPTSPAASARTTWTRRSATPYELPPDRCYGETCAAIASVHVELADAAGDRRGALRRPARAHALQRRARRARAGRRRLLLRQPAARARRASRPGRARRATPAVVRVRVLPAERDAAAGEPAALRRDPRRGGSPDPPVRDRHVRPGAGAHRLPVGRARRDRGVGAGRVDVEPARPRLVRGRGSTASRSAPGYAR